MIMLDEIDVETIIRPEAILSDEVFEGVIDSISVYNRKLTIAEILTIFDDNPSARIPLPIKEFESIDNPSSRY